MHIFPKPQSHGPRAQESQELKEYSKFSEGKLEICQVQNLPQANQPTPRNQIVPHPLPFSEGCLPAQLGMARRNFSTRVLGVGVFPVLAEGAGM